MKCIILCTCSYAVFKNSFLRNQSIKAAFAAPASQLNFSLGEVQWLRWMEYSEYPDLMHRFNSISKLPKFGPYFPDGVAPKSMVLFEYLGCSVHYHSKDCKFLPHNIQNTDRNYLGIPYYMALGKLEQKLNFYKKKFPQWRVRTIWACQWLAFKALKNNNPYNYIRSIYKDHPTQRLQSRDFIRGGKVSLLSISADMSKAVNADLKIYAFDVNSLYPAISIQNQFMYEVPQIAIGKSLSNLKILENRFYWKDPDSCQLKRMKFGIFQCRVMMRRNNLCAGIPFLLKKDDKKSMAIECLSCANRQHKGFCRCPDEKRSWIETYSQAELEVALKYGYDILQIFEVFSFVSKSSLLQQKKIMSQPH